MRNDFETGYLEHSAKGTTWRKKAAKYLSRVWKNGRWVYRYKITGKGYKWDAEANKNKSNARKMSGDYRGAERYGRLSAQAQSGYTKSLAAQIEKGTKKINSMLSKLKTTTTRKVTSNLMPAGEEKVIKEKIIKENIIPEKKIYENKIYENDVVNVKELSEKNKKKKKK